MAQTIPEQMPRADDLGVSLHGASLSGRHVWAWLPLGLCAVGVIASWTASEHLLGGTRLLLPVLNSVFLVVISLLVAFLAGRSILAGGPLSVLLLGAGSLAIGLASALAAMAVPGGRHDAGVAIYNIGICLAGGCNLLAGLHLLLPARWPKVRWPGTALYTGYGAVVLVMAVAAWLVPTPWIPTFFVQGQGPTVLRQVVLGTAIAEFLLAALLLRVAGHRSGSSFLHWYSLGMALIATGLLGVYRIVHLDSLEAWVGRGAQYIAGVYLLVAALIAVRGSRRWMIPLETLRETHGRYMSLVEFSPDAILVHAKGRYIFANPAAARLFGAASPQDLVGRSVLDLVHPEHRDLVARRIHATARDLQATPLAELKVLRLDGEPVDVEAVGVQVVHEGRPATQVVLRDITARKQADRALAEKNSQLHAMFEHSNAGLVLFDAQPPYRVLAANRYYQDLWPEPYRSRGLVGLALTEFAPGLEEAGITDVFRQVAQAGKGRAIRNTPYDHMAGGRRWWNWTLEPVIQDGRVVALAHLAIDVTQEVNARQQAEQATQAVQRVLSTITEGYYVLDSEWRFVEMNGIAERHFGRAAAELLGRSIWEQTGMPVSSIVHEKFHEAARTRRPVEFEAESRVRPGFWSNLHLYPQDDGLHVYFHDITERKQAEAALRASEARLRLATEAARMFTWECDVPAQAIRWSENAAGVIGCRAEELPQEMAGSHFFVAPEDSPRVRQDFAEIIGRGQSTYTLEFRGQGAGETIRHWLAQGRVLYGADGSPLRIFGVTQDITVRKQAEEALRESDRRYSALFANKINGMAHCRIITDENGQPVDYWILQVNEAYERIIGVKKADIEGRRVTEVFPHIKDYAFDYIGVYGKIALEGGEIQFEEFFEATGQYLSIYAYSPLPGEFAAIFTDVTERKRSEQQLKELNETLEKRVAERTAVAEVRAEQLRMLAQELTQAEQRERQRIAHILHEHFQQLLVGAKFNLSMVQAKDADSQESLRRTDQVLGEAVEASRSLAVELSPPILHYGGLAPALAWLGQWMRDRHGLKVEVVAEPHVPTLAEDVQILLFQAVRELLFNVVKHAKVCDARVELKKDEGRLLRLSVLDKGPGFEADRPMGKARASGGFGLFSIRERFSLLEGRVEIQSTPGAGTCVSLLVPLSPATQASVPAGATPRGSATASGREDGEANPTLAFGAKIRVLIADDHAIVRDGLSRLLQTQPDMEVAGQAEDGRQAVELARRLRPAVVIMDVTMPELDGIEATRCILADLPDARIIGLSMHIDQDVAARMRQAGAVDYLAKTGPTDGLVAVIRQHAARAASGP